MQDLIKKIAEKGHRVFFAVNGLPLCGKTTVADGIASVIGGERITTSSALRGLQNPNINEMIENGILVPDKFVVDAISASLQKTNHTLVIVDGCFRTENQTRAIISHAHDLRFGLVVAVEVNVTYPTIRERFTTRGRRDDTLQKVASRIRDYQHHAPRTLFALADLTRYQVSVNGDAQREAVLQEALEKLGHCLQDHLEPVCVFSRR